MSEPQEYEIRDESIPNDYFSQIPNLVDIMGLSPHAYRLYGHLKKVTGETGKCWQSTTTLAKACNMSSGMVSKSKQELESVYPPLVRIESKPFDRGAYHEIVITDIWAINHAFWTGEAVTIKRADGIAFHNMNDYRSYYELDRSQYETKKNPTKNNPIHDENKNSSITEDLELKRKDTMPLDWRIQSGQPVTQADLDAAQSSQPIPGEEYFTQFHPDELRYAVAWARYTGHGPAKKSTAVLWRAGIQEAISEGLTPQDLIDALTPYVEGGGKVKGPGSVVTEARTRKLASNLGIEVKPKFQKKETVVPEATKYE